MIVKYKLRTPLIYYFTPKRWLAYCMWQLKLLVDRYHRGTTISELCYAEQVIYRKQACITCNNSGKSNCCNCDFRGLILQKQSKCKFHMWPEMMNDKDWAEFKKVNNITINI